MEIGKILKQRRLELKLTLEDVGNAVGVGKSTVKKWEDGYIANMKRDKIASLASVLQISPSVIMGWNDENGTFVNNIIPMPQFNTVPLLGTIACGEPILADENLEGEVSIPDDIKADFALRCSGDSMIDARILDGDIVYIRQQPTVNNGEIAAVLIGDEATLKKVFISEGTITLLACNSNYQPFVYSGEKLNEIRILGKAVGFTSRI
ncbi:MAG: helix-turn-helix domain-containing protein [Clostridia bacterium]|nr:helix-turn-helix domain-containing protein [Clostridia bacterium]